MIVKNEEDFLANCLNSVKDIADEIIIVDTGSTDNTINIAKKFNAKIISFNWVNDFSAARNESLKHATKDWILVLDADETIANSDLKKIKELTKTNNQIGYSFIQRSYTDNSSSPKWISSKDDDYEESKRYAGWIQTKLIRLFPKGTLFRNPVHETVVESIKERGAKIIPSNIPIHHYGKIKKNVKEKTEKYFELGKKKETEKDDAKTLYEVGVQALNLMDYTKAIHSFVKSIQKNNFFLPSYLNLGSALIRVKKYDDAAEVLSDAIKLSPNNSDLHNNLGVVYEKLEKTDLAIKEFEKATEIKDNIEAYFNLSRIYFTSGNIDKSIEMLEKIIEINPKRMDVYHNLGGLYFKKGEKQKAIAILEKALQIDPKNEVVRKNLENVRKLENAQ